MANQSIKTKIDEKEETSVVNQNNESRFTENEKTGMDIINNKDDLIKFAVWCGFNDIDVELICKDTIELLKPHIELAIKNCAYLLQFSNIKQGQ